MPRTCGDCTMCCKVMGVKELEKPQNVWCPSCKIGQGCGIYSTRPETCRIFECLWLQNEDFPEELRPDKSKAVLSCNLEGTAITVYVDPKQGEVWINNELLSRVLKGIAMQGTPVIIVSGAKRKLITSEPEAVIEKMHLTEEASLDVEQRRLVPRIQSAKELK